MYTPINFLALRGHRLGCRLGLNLFWSMVKGVATLGKRNSYKSSALVSLCIGLFFLVPTFLSCRPLAAIFLSCICFFLLLHPFCSHARGILCGIHTTYVGSPFPIVYAKWSLVLRSVNNSYSHKTALSPVLIKKKSCWLFNIRKYRKKNFNRFKSKSYSFHIVIVSLSWYHYCLRPICVCSWKLLAFSSFFLFTCAIY